jgi:cytochrome c553
LALTAGKSRVGTSEQTRKDDTLHPLLRYLAIALLVLRPLTASAQSIEEKAQLCAACHGEDGVPQETPTPVIWGQTEGYLYLQLRDYKLGTRKNEIMSQIASTLEKQDMFDLAAYFTAKPWPNLPQAAASDDDTKQALTANTAVGCTGCHLDKYQGTGTAPRLSDQRAEYLEGTMIAFRNKERGNNPGMTSLMNSISESDIKALAAYLAAL